MTLCASVVNFFSPIYCRHIVCIIEASLLLPNIERYIRIHCLFYWNSICFAWYRCVCVPMRFCSKYFAAAVVVVVVFVVFQLPVTFWFSVAPFLVGSFSRCDLCETGFERNAHLYYILFLFARFVCVCVLLVPPTPPKFVSLNNILDLARRFDLMWLHVDGLCKYRLRKEIIILTNALPLHRIKSRLNHASTLTK